MGVMDDDHFEFPSIHWGEGGPPEWNRRHPLSGWTKLIAGVIAVILVVTFVLLARYTI